MLESVRQDLRYALRWLGRSPGFTLVAVLSLGLGVGVNTAMYSVVDTMVLRPLPVAAPDELVDVFTTGGDGDVHATSSYPDFLDLRAQNAVFSDMIAFSPALAALSVGGDRSRLVLSQLVTSNHFAMLGITPAHGRLLEARDDEPAAARVVAISHRLWRNDFASDPGVVGRSLTIRGQAYTIVGVAPQHFTGVVPMLNPALWLPITQAEEVEPAGINDYVPSPTGKTRVERRGSRWLFVKGRLKPGVRASDAQAQMAVLGRQLAAAHPQTNAKRQMSAVPTRDVRFMVPQASGPINAGAAGLMAIVGLVLLIACANVAGMLLARATTRQREISVRLAVGASRGRLIQQLLIEGAVLGLLGSVVAIACAWVLVRALVGIDLPFPGTFEIDLRIDRRVLGFALAVAALTGLLAGLLPAIKASAPSLVDSLRGEAPAARAGGRRWALRDLLAAAQVALTAVLLVVAGLLLRSVLASQSADVGFETRGLATVSVDTDMVRLSKEQGEQFWSRALGRVRLLPGVDQAALATPRLPFSLNFTQVELHVDGRTYGPEDRGEITMNAAVSPGYFETLGVAIVQGRGFTAADRRSAPRVAVVNQTMAKRLWPGESAVGKVVTAAVTKERYEIVGVAADHKVYAVGEPPTAFIHFAAAQAPSSYHYLVARTRGSAGAMVSAIRRELQALQPGTVFVSSETMESALAVTLLPARIGAALALGFSLLGTLLAALGLYGVMAYSVSRRTREIGIRMALGARPGSVVGTVLTQGLTLSVAGMVVGLALAAVAARLLSGVLYGVSAADPVAWTAAVGVMLTAALAAHLVPARRAARVEPSIALRND